MPVTKKCLAYCSFSYCLHGGAPCTARQMRNGFLTLNWLAWIFIISALNLLT